MGYSYYTRRRAKLVVFSHDFHAVRFFITLFKALPGLKPFCISKIAVYALVCPQRFTIRESNKLSRDASATTNLLVVRMLSGIDLLRP